MKKLIYFFLFFSFTQTIHAQLTIPPNGGNKKASVSEQIALTQVTVNYNRPGVKGREGKIWGELVHTGFSDLGFGESKAAPWRAGANENTTIEFSTDVTINGKPLAAGKYGLFLAYDPQSSIFIFSKNNNSWGSYFYNDKNDALRVEVKPVDMEKSKEWLTYEFINQTDSTATLALQWERKMFPILIAVDYVQTQMESFRRELYSNKGFEADAWQQAAEFAATHHTNLDEALQWSDYSVNGRFIGEKNFKNMATRATLLWELNRDAEAEAIMNEALPMASENELHMYARTVLQQGKVNKALEIFQMNYKHHPNTFTTNTGMARGLSAKGDYKQALKYATAALPQAPDEQNKAMVQKNIELLKEGKDINQ